MAIVYHNSENRMCGGNNLNTFEKTTSRIASINGAIILLVFMLMCYIAGTAWPVTGHTKSRGLSGAIFLCPYNNERTLPVTLHDTGLYCFTIIARQ